MTFLITIFYISLAGVISTLALKKYQLWLDRDMFFDGLVRKFDFFLKQQTRDWAIVLKTRRSSIKSRFNVFVHVSVKLWIAKRWHTTSIYYDRLYCAINGKKLLRHKGAVSFYLKDIAKFKQHLSAHQERRG